MMYSLLAVFAGGGIGSMARFGIGRLSAMLFPASFPVATLLSNVISCVILGITLGFFSEKIFTNSTLRFFILTGFCGGFSTFSTFSHETLDLFRSGNFFFAVLNIVLNIVACLVVILLFTKTS